MHTHKIGRSKKAKAVKATLEQVNFPDTPGDTEHTLLGDTILFVTVDYDQDAQNPCKDWDGQGAIRSLSHRHIDNISIEEARGLLESDPDTVALSYFEHGQSLWMVAGSPTPPGVEFQWDGARFAGIWTPDSALLDEVKGLSAEDRRTKMVEFAGQCCEVYTQFCNGECYGYSIEMFKVRKDDDGEPYDALDDYRREKAVADESCWGFFGWDDFLTEVKSSVKGIIQGLAA